MRLIGILLTFVLLASSSCLSKKKTMLESNQDIEFKYGKVNRLEIPILEYSSEFKFVYLIKNKDTTENINLNCLLAGDTVAFSKALDAEKIVATPECLEYRIEGKSWYSLEIDSFGNFSNLEVLKPAFGSTCLPSIVKEITTSVGKLKVLEENYSNATFIFYHDLTIVDTGRSEWR